MDKDEHSRVIGSGLCLLILGILDQYSKPPLPKIAKHRVSSHPHIAKYSAPHLISQHQQHYNTTTLQHHNITTSQHHIFPPLVSLEISRPSYPVGTI
jgi:hypothetical protein